MTALKEFIDRIFNKGLYFAKPYFLKAVDDVSIEIQTGESFGLVEKVGQEKGSPSHCRII